MPASTEPEHVRNRRALRRKWAAVAFWLLCAQSVLILAAVILVDGAAASINTATGVITPLLAFLTTLVGGYLLIGHRENMKATEQ